MSSRYLEIEKQTNTLIVHGMKEIEEDDDDAVLTANLLRVVLQTDESKHIEKVYRIGHLTDNQVRPIILRIKSIETKQVILCMAKDLKDSMGYEVYITPDLTRKRQ